MDGTGSGSGLLRGLPKLAKTSRAKITDRSGLTQIFKSDIRGPKFRRLSQWRTTTLEDSKNLNGIG